MVKIKFLWLLAFGFWLLVNCQQPTVNSQNKTGGDDNMFTPSLTWADKELVTHTKMNTMTANDDDLDTRLDLCLLAGAGSSGTTRLASGDKSGSLSSASSTIETVTYATDCDDGDPDFDGVRQVVATLEVTSGYENLIVIVSDLDNDGYFTAKVLTADGSNQTSSFIIRFMVVGVID